LMDSEMHLDIFRYFWALFEYTPLLSLLIKVLDLPAGEHDWTSGRFSVNILPWFMPIKR
jgi:hypothetical protein